MPWPRSAVTRSSPASRIAAGIDVQMLSDTMPGGERLVGTGANQRTTEANDALARIAAAHPHRFASSAALPMREPDAAAVELRRAVDELGFSRALVHGLVNGCFLDDPRFRPVLSQAEQLGVPIYLDLAAPPAAVAGVYFSGLPRISADHLATAAWGWHSKTALHVLRLIVAGIFDEFPALQVIIEHTKRCSCPSSAQHLLAGVGGTGPRTSGRVFAQRRQSPPVLLSVDVPTGEPLGRDLLRQVLR